MSSARRPPTDPLPRRDHVRRVLTVVVSLLAFVLTGAGPAAAE
jgi:hypothetical protein